MSVAQSALDQARELLNSSQGAGRQFTRQGRPSRNLAGMLVEVGEQVTSRHALARVSDPTRLKADVRIAETQARDIRPDRRR